MVKISGPLFSVGAHGSIAKELTYSKRRSGQQARKYNKPTGAPSAKQQSHRRLNEFATIQWQCMSDATKATWEVKAKASGLRIAGYHYFLREALKDPYENMDLVGFWPMNEIVSNKIQDLSGNNLDFDLKPTPPSDAPVLQTGLQDKFGKALFFDGGNDYCRADYKAPFNVTAKFYIEFWCKVTIGANMVIMQQWYAAAGDDEKYFYYIKDNGKVTMVLNVAATAYYPTSDLVLDSKVHCVAISFDGSHVKFYLDGVSDGTNHVQPGPLEDSAAKVWIGNYNTGTYWMNGKLAQLCMYRRSLSAAEILKRYQYAIRKI